MEEKVINEKTQGQLGAAMLIVVILVSTFATKRDAILAYLTKTNSRYEDRVERGSGDVRRKR